MVHLNGVSYNLQNRPLHHHSIFAQSHALGSQTIKAVVLRAIWFGKWQHLKLNLKSILTIQLILKFEMTKSIFLSQSSLFRFCRVNVRSTWFVGIGFSMKPFHFFHYFHFFGQKLLFMSTCTTLANHSTVFLFLASVQFGHNYNELWILIIIMQIYWIKVIGFDLKY